MREIKFRAWDNERRRFVLDEHDAIQLFIYKGTISFIESVKVELMQYTGLKDKTGKDIYEGDICSISLWFGLQYTGYVVFENGGFQIIYLNGGRNRMTTLFDGNSVYATVIGNIYENPELLKGVDA